MFWANDAVFYSIYPMGLCSAPTANDFISKPVMRLAQIKDWIPHIKQLGCNALYLGPVFESDFHGYDTANYLLVDRRLGINQTLTDLAEHLHENEIKLVLDGVFNHVGRNFFAFKDLQLNKELSVYKGWFCGVDFNGDSVYGDGFYYDGWYDAYNLVKLNLQNPAVKQYLFSAVEMWIETFRIDGLRLDVAEIIDKQFLAELADFCRNIQPGFWLMGEVIGGDYNQWTNEQMLDSTTNYEAYKGIYSSHNDHNYHEIAYSLDRQFGEYGIYKNLKLYNFVDNHDTTRIASILNKIDHLLNVYILLFTMPGIPSIYYGSEWGIMGLKGEHEDVLLRPAITSPPELNDCAIFNFIRQLIQIRKTNPVLLHGDYRTLYVTHKQLVFERRTETEIAITALNAADQPCGLQVTIDLADGTGFIDQLDPLYFTNVFNSLLAINIPANCGRVLTVTFP